MRARLDVYIMLSCVFYFLLFNIFDSDDDHRHRDWQR